MCLRVKMYVIRFISNNWNRYPLQTEDCPEIEESDEDVSNTLLVEKCANKEVEIAAHVPQTVASEALKTDDLKTMLAESNSTAQMSLDVKEMQLKLEQANNLIEKLGKSKWMLLKHVKRLAYEKKKLTTENNMLIASKSINRVFNKDQMTALYKKTVRGCKWSDDTIRKALRLKLSCGSSGFQELLDQGIPLPAERTLRRRCEGLEFQPGICEQVFEILQQRVSQFTDDREKDCMIALDEMSITPGNQVDHGTMSYTGLSTLPDNFGKGIKYKSQ